MAVRPAIVVALAGLLVMLTPGCGAEPDRATTGTAPTRTAPTATDSTATVAAPDLAPYLLRADDGAGLEPMSSPQIDTGEPFDLPENGAALLERSGYLSTTYVTAQGEASAGVSSVLLFETAAGARDWMAYETSREAIQHQIPGVDIERFRVPGVPGAEGWTGPDLHGNAIGHVYWTQGRCMLLIGLEVEGPRVERLSAAVQSIFERTGGTCPE